MCLLGDFSQGLPSNTSRVAVSNTSQETMFGLLKIPISVFFCLPAEQSSVENDIP